jgi:hypothetical protein
MNKGMTDRKWLDFVRWCQARGLAAFPAHPWTVAAFARWCESRRTLVSITGSVRVIARVHLLNASRSPDRDPMVVRTLRGIALRKGGGGGGSLFRAGDFTSRQDTGSRSHRRDPETDALAKKAFRMRPPLVRRRPQG